MNRVCGCRKPKLYELTFDGGSLGSYSVSVCKTCYSEIGREFLIKEMKLTESL